ncbi:MAG: 2-aminoethylphosphonate--pyruvate transaminase [Clostridiales Family XIII bacterium]|jgi:2-aminoethylphosphonate-pyruvate transaminase|nr:2-aminoethylphosphonate--pyruvate transaminase [Clostridiales Family XIII bacterium]
MNDFIPDNPYILLTPGPLSTSKGVRGAMLRDWCTWDADYNVGIVQDIRRRLAGLAAASPEDYTVALMQGSGSFAVEACLGSAVPRQGKLLIIRNGAYGERMCQMARVLGVRHVEYATAETEAPEPRRVAEILDGDPAVTHVAMVHCETTTGILNPLEGVAKAVKSRGKTLIIDAMSSFGGIPFDAGALGIDFLISSANKCVQGVPGFAFVIAKRAAMAACEGNARSLCLDLHDQWREMDGSGKWRYTSPTHVTRAFFQALDELEAEGGVAARHARYQENHRTLVEGMRGLGFRTLLADALQSPIITSFLYPRPDFDFGAFYDAVKERGFVLYPGKISQADTFRIGSIGEVYPGDMRRLLAAVRDVSEA